MDWKRKPATALDLYFKAPVRGRQKKRHGVAYAFFLFQKRTSTSTQFFDVKTVKTQMPRQQRDVEY
jgi:hypothetical protein